MKRTNVLFVLMLLVTALSAQKKVAVFDSADDSNSGMTEIVREVLSTGLTNTSEYAPVERALIQQVLQENKYQASGMVDESKISDLGKQMGADYVCISIIKKMGTNYFVTAKLVDVTTATVILQKYVNTTKGTDDLFEKTEELSGKLFGERNGRSNRNNGSSSITSNEQKTTSESNNEAFSDMIDNKNYEIVKIGEQIWMAENLAYKANSNCWVYDENNSNISRYGYLYDWETAQKVCPSGWHLPSDDEWKTLERNLGMSEEHISKDEWRGKGIGAKLKSPSGWLNDNEGNNQSGFNALPGGLLHYSKKKGYSSRSGGAYGFWWSSTPYGDNKAWIRRLHTGSIEVGRFAQIRTSGCSVRCIKD